MFRFEFAGVSMTETAVTRVTKLLIVHKRITL